MTYMVPLLVCLISWKREHLKLNAQMLWLHCTHLHPEHRCLNLLPFQTQHVQNGVCYFYCPNQFKMCSRSYTQHSIPVVLPNYIHSRLQLCALPPHITILNSHVTSLLKTFTAFKCWPQLTFPISPSTISHFSNVNDKVFPIIPTSLYMLFSLPGNTIFSVKSLLIFNSSNQFIPVSVLLELSGKSHL